MSSTLSEIKSNDDLDSSTLKFVFHHNHVGTSKIHGLNNFENSCECKSCKTQNKLLPFIAQLFFLGFIFPLVYFIIWGFKIYATILFSKQCKNVNENSFSETDSKFDKNKLTDKEYLDGSSDPFSDIHVIQSDNRQLKKNERNSYDYEVHIKTNKKFNTWCGRSLIAFTCQISLIIVIVCAVVAIRQK